MGPFGDSHKPVRSGRRCFPFRRCEVCSRLSPQLLEEFFAMVRGSWSTAEIDILSKAAHSALLLPSEVRESRLPRAGMFVITSGR